MAAQPITSTPDLHVPEHPVRIVTASALFDGHDASINIMRRIMQAQGAEVIHLGHNRSVREVVDAAIEEDVQGVAVSSYQGGHVEYFEYLVQLLRESGAGHVKVVGGGGGVIVPAEIERLRAAGVTIFSPEDGQRLGLPGMVNQVVAACDTDLWEAGPTTAAAVISGERSAVARAITAAETGHLGDALWTHPFTAARIPLWIMRNRLGLGQDGPEVRRAVDAYLEPWTDRWDRTTLRELLTDAERISCLHRAESWRRLQADVPVGRVDEPFLRSVPEWLVDAAAPDPYASAVAR